MIEIRSGGQDGADLAGWRAARDNGLPTSGWMPKGFLTESGPRPEYRELYGAREHASADYKPRRQANIKDADATIIFISARAKSSRGSWKTKEECDLFGKPVKAIHAGAPEVPPTAKVAAWIRHYKYRTLNIAGTRLSSDPPVPGEGWLGVETWVYCYLMDVFSLVKEGRP